MAVKNILQAIGCDFRSSEFFYEEYFQKSQTCHTLSFSYERQASSALSFDHAIQNNIALSFNQAGQDISQAGQDSIALSWNALSYYESCLDPGADTHFGWFSKPKSDELSHSEIQQVLLDVDKKLSETIAWISDKETIELAFLQDSDDFTIHRYWHQIFHDSYDFGKWYHEVVPQVASVEFANKLSGQFKSIARKFTLLRRLISVLIRRFSLGNLRMDFRTVFRKKTNNIFKNLDDEHHLNFQRVN